VATTERSPFLVGRLGTDSRPSTGPRRPGLRPG
jgi:hypothetical protein